MLRYRNGLNPVWQLRGEMDRLFGDLLNRANVLPGDGTPQREAFPPLNVWE
jgi:hypothetical protein